jgi:hypothetical protein
MPTIFMGKLKNYSFFKERAELLLRFFGVPFSLWKCGLHNLIHTLAVLNYPPHFVLSFLVGKV